MSDELPVGWSACTLGDIVESIETGKSVKCDERPPLGEENGLVKISAVTWGTFNEQESKTLFDSSHLKPEEKIQLGDFLISRANTLELVGSCVLVKQLSKNLYLSDKVLRLVLADESKPWLLTCLRTENGRKQIESLATGNQLSMRNISQQALKEIRIPLPPLAEQTRIAQKLDELLAQVDTLKARIDGIPALLKRFRQSVLAAAVSGRLTDEWRLTSPSEDAWKKGGFTDFFDIQGGTQPPKSTFIDHPADGYVQLVQIRDFGEKSVPTFVPDSKSLKKFESDDYLIGRYGASVGRICTGLSGAYNVALVKVVSLKSDWIYKPFLGVLLRSPTFQSAITGFERSAQDGFNKNDLASIEVSLPPATEQTEIVRRVEQLFAFADQLEAKVASAKSRIDHLTKSILAKAFRGELVPQDANDEPASVLLERIKAQRAAAPKAKRGRKASA